MTSKFLLFIGLIILVMAGCKPDPADEEPEFHATPYDLQIPSLFPPMDIPADNPLTVEGIKLGRYLFWEKKLSGDNTQSCGSCHLPQNGFSDPNQFSVGITGAHGTRQAMALVNLGWAHNYFWDGRAQTLEDQVQQPVQNPIEMNEDWNNAVSELSADPQYRAMFKAAYGTEDVTREKSAQALASFLRTLISADSKFDRERAGTYTFTPLEDAGFNLFLKEGGWNNNTGAPWGGADCFHCHGQAGMQMGDYQMHNNGLNSTFENDPGRADFTGNPLDSGMFKTPSLRNIAVTGPYMHDGRFQTLDEVVDHYNTGGHLSTTIDPFMEAAGGGLYLEDIDKLAIISFLNCLTDTAYINNPAFRDPH